MTKYPAANISFRVYEDAVNEIGLAKLSLPEIGYQVITLNASGLMGTIEVPLMGMLNNMELGLDFLSTSDPANFAKMLEPRKHQIEARIAEENWDIEDTEVGVWAPKHVFIARPKTMTPGDIAPATAANANGRMTVYYWAAYRDGTQLWELDKRNMKCVINGVDYMADVRKALGYS